MLLFRHSLAKNLFLFASFVTLTLSCKSDYKSKLEGNPTPLVTVNGKTMGTTYHIAYVDSTSIDYKESIDSLLIEINQAVSTYIPSSIISQINIDSLGKTATILKNGLYTNNIKYEIPLNQHFLQNYITSVQIFRKTSGYFDPTVMPLVNYWGFGYTAKKPVTKTDSAKVKKLISTVGFGNWSDQIGIDKMQYIKPPKAQLDFSAIAKGYAVDQVGRFLESKSVKNYIVEIGGEVYCRGQKTKEKKWTIALSKPEVNASINEVEMAVQLNDVGLASSGNYRIFYEVEDQIYGHEINPLTGYPEMNDLLGVSVIANNCMIADAYATAFMIMGKEKSIDLVEELVGTEAIFFHASTKNEIIHTQSSGFHRYVKPN